MVYSGCGTPSFSGRADFLNATFPAFNPPPDRTHGRCWNCMGWKHAHQVFKRSVFRQASTVCDIQLIFIYDDLNRHTRLILLVAQGVHQGFLWHKGALDLLPPSYVILTFMYLRCHPPNDAAPRPAIPFWSTFSCRPKNFLSCLGILFVLRPSMWRKSSSFGIYYKTSQGNPALKAFIQCAKNCIDTIDWFAWAT